MNAEIKSEIEGVRIYRPHVYEDSRGWLGEIFRADQLAKEIWPVMAYLSSTWPGVPRGPHEHRQQTDLLCFLGSSEFAIQLWDNRPLSPTQGRSEKQIAHTNELFCLIIPPGIVHAYRNIGMGAGLVLNAPNRLYAGPGRREDVDQIRYEDDPASPFKVEL